ncbi:YxiG family protein [Sporosarcina ureae]|uniref:Uncharacterized protein n=1 Tax=Sporosarcina ureae TaxID=1571 RepID=A0ABM6JSH2_SPOUR|nr:hypothetical protein [Sporosarcina ureae]ARF12994.1 hypothetical protein SporoS204_01665 [Sporosarcina ureae]
MKNNNDLVSQEIRSLFADNAEFWIINDIQVNYLEETIVLNLVSVSNQQILKTFIKFKQVMSLFIYQDAEIETYRLNNYKENDPFLLSEISYHPNGFGKINIKSLEPELPQIESISSSTNFYFQVNNKDCFFIEANSLMINEKVYRNLIVDEETIKSPY